MTNDLVKVRERPAYSFLDSRAIWASQDYWHVIWMAVSCCCGLQGEALPVRLPDPSPKVIH
jgi:hypothetical protein